MADSSSARSTGTKKAGLSGSAIRHHYPRGLMPSQAKFADCKLDISQSRPPFTRACTSAHCPDLGWHSVQNLGSKSQPAPVRHPHGTRLFRPPRSKASGGRAPAARQSRRLAFPRSRWKYSVSNFYDRPFNELGHQRAEQDCRYDSPSYCGQPVHGVSCFE